MLELDSEPLRVDGVTVYGDHARGDLFWYLPPSTPQIVRRGPERTPQLTLISFRPQSTGAGARGGGFLNLEVALPLEPATERRILSRLASRSDGPPRLSPAPIVSGRVRIMALDLEGGGGTTGTTPPGAFRVTERILGATVPALAGEMNAVFGLTLTEEGATIMREAFAQGGLPIGVGYEFTYDALRPALDVRISANFKRVYDHLSMGIDLTAGFPVGGVPVYLDVGIDLAFEKLVQEGVIEIEVINFSTESDKSDKEQWALDFFKNELLKDWFTPTLPPIRPSTAEDETGDSDGDDGSAGGGEPSGSDADEPGIDRPEPGGGTPGNTDTDAPPSDGPAGDEDDNADAPVLVEPGAPETARTRGDAERALADAVLEQTHENAHRGNTVVLEQQAGERGVSLRFSSAADAPALEIDGAAHTLDAEGVVRIDLPAGATRRFIARYSPRASAPDSYRLRFSKDRPRERGFSIDPPSAAYLAYIGGDPDDAVFLPPPGAASGHDRGGFETWLSHAPGPLTLDAHASFERTDREDEDRALSERRLAVALGIVGRSAEIARASAHGFRRARDERRTDDPIDRVVEISRHEAPSPATLIRGTLSRALLSEGPSGGGDGGGSGDTGEDGGGDDEQPPPPAGGDGGDPGTGDTDQPDGPTRPPLTPPKPGDVGVRLAFRLQKIEQIEDKRVTLHYNRRQAVQRVHAPQGLLSLMAADLEGPPHFIDVDLDAPFFRELEVLVDVPLAFDRIGLLAVDLELEYGDPAEPATLKREDFRFTAEGTRSARARFFLNRALDLHYHQRLEYHFDPDTGWEGRAHSYRLERERSADRTLLVNPHRHFRFLEVAIVAGELDAGIVEQSEVHLRYDGTRFAARGTFIVRPGAPTQLWRLRLESDEVPAISYTLRHHLNDGTQIERGPFPLETASLTVNDPFEDPLVVEFVPNLDADGIRELFVTVRYRDRANDYENEAQVRFVPGRFETQRLRLARYEDGPREYEFQTTVLGDDHSIRRFEPITTAETIVFLGEHIDVDGGA